MTITISYNQVILSIMSILTQTGLLPRFQFELLVCPDSIKGNKTAQMIFFESLFNLNIEKRCLLKRKILTIK